MRVRGLCAVLFSVVLVGLVLTGRQVPENLAKGEKQREAKQPARNDNFNFLSELELVLDKGFMAKADSAAPACAALFFSEDKQVVEGARSSALNNRKAYGKQLLLRMIRTLTTMKEWRNSKLASFRMAAILSLARSVGDGHTYMRVAIWHLGSDRVAVQSQAAGWTISAQKWLAQEITGKSKPPHFWRLAPPDESAKLHKAYKEWSNWIEKADRKLVDRAMNKMFASDSNRLNRGIRG